MGKGKQGYNLTPQCVVGDMILTGELSFSGPGVSQSL